MNTQPLRNKAMELLAKAEEIDKHQAMADVLIDVNEVIQQQINYHLERTKAPKGLTGILETAKPNEGGSMPLLRENCEASAKQLENDEDSFSNRCATILENVGKNGKGS